MQQIDTRELQSLVKRLTSDLKAERNECNSIAENLAQSNETNSVLGEQIKDLKLKLVEYNRRDGSRAQNEYCRGELELLRQEHEHLQTEFMELQDICEQKDVHIDTIEK